MKFKKLTVLALVACLAFTACGKDKEEPAERNETPAVQESVVTEPSEAQEDPDNTGSSVSVASGSSTYLTSGTVGAYTYEVEPNYTADKSYYDLSKRGWMVDFDKRDSSPLWLIITSGEKSTGGYGINLVDVQDEGNGTICVTVEETAPEPTDMVTEALTYPHIVIRFDYGSEGTPKNFKVVNTAGEELYSY